MIKTRFIYHAVIIAFGALAAFSLPACDSGSAIDITKVENRITRVYAAGEDNNAAAYWKNGDKKYLDAGGNGTYAKSIHVVDGNVYIAGVYDSGSFINACYWNNGARIALGSDLTEEGSEGTAIFFYHGSPHIVGLYDNGSNIYSCLWINTAGERTYDSTLIRLYALYIDESGEYRAGSYGNPTRYAYYWNNNDSYPLPVSGATSSVAYGITAAGPADGPVIHVVGEASLGSDRAFYWKTGDTDLTFISANASCAYAVAVDGTDVYIAGVDSGRACYWENGTLHYLSDYSSESLSVCITDGNVYIAGCDWYDNGSDTWKRACYWKNGTRVLLPSTDTVDSKANSIYVTVEQM